MMRSIRKKIKETPLVGRVIDSLISSNPRENAPSIQAVLDQIGIRDNLLVNSDFRYHIINQWGQDYYNSSYSVDMWYVSGSGRISLKNNRLDVQLWKSDSVEGSAQLKQILEVQVKGVHTYTVNLKACTSYCKMYIKNSNGEIIKQYVNVGINSLTYTGTAPITEVGLLIEEGEYQSCYIGFFKLEEGSMFTGMPAYNIPLEYLKCRRRIYNAAPATNYGVIGTGFVISATKVRVFINLPISQAKSPSIVYNGTFEVWTEKGVVTPTKIEVNNGVRGKLEIAVDITIPTRSGLANGDYVVLRNKNVTTNIFMIDAYDY